MNNLLAWILLIGGIYFIFLSFSLATKNLRSAVIFKVLPFLFGLGNIVGSLKLFDIIKFNIK